MKLKKPLLLALGLFLLILALAACGPSQQAATPCPTPAECPKCPECPSPEVPEAPAVEVPFLDLWTSSGHADAKAEAFIHWNEADPKEVPVACAKCHSTPGYQDFVGADGSAAGTVDKAAAIGTTVTCVACHNEATLVMDSVVMPSGAEISGLGREARCMQCHQGRESTVSVDEAIAKAGVDVDTVSADLGFRNIHYYAAAATKYGTMAKGGYQYESKSYDGNFAHVAAFDTCVGCHNSHTLELKVEACSTCHTGVSGKEDLKNVRMQSSLVDYDGDGNVTEGIYYELEGVRGALYQAIQAYGKDKAGTPVAYDAAAYPYFFVDTNGNGTADPDEAKAENGFKAWTPRLLKAAYNYQVSIKDPGAFAHGGKYIIELLYDSIEDLNPDLVASLRRIDAGHFAGSEEAFRHWDEEGQVPVSCSKCHSGTGLPFYLKEGVTASQPLSNGLLCTTCHDSLPEFTRYAVNEVQFPSGAKLSFGEGADANLCLQCHQGRESTVSVDKAIGDLDEDTVSDKLSFRNVHYFAAGATLFGTEAKAAYEYEGQTYNGRNAHVEPYSQCTQCHDTHGLELKVKDCATCHAGIEKPQDIRMATTDFDRDSDTKEGIAGEVATLHEALYAAVQDYATKVAGTAIVYDAHTHPYFFIDTNGNGTSDPDEAKSDNRYNAWTPRLLKAAYNYQYVAKDPGAFAHNGKYIIQILYDSLADIGKKASVDMKGMTRP